MNSSGNEEQRKRIRRTTRACDYCHRRSIRCRPTSDRLSCQNCFEFDQACTFERQVKKRGTRPALNSRVTSRTGADLPHVPDATGRHETGHDVHDHYSSQSPLSGGGILPAINKGRAPSQRQLSSTETWQAPYIASQATVMDLVELYFEIVYPIFPFYHEPSLIRSVSRGEYTTKRTLFADTMAVCALVSARVRDKAVFNPKWNTITIQETDPDLFYTEAARQAANSESLTDLNLMRAHAVLSIAAIQHGRTRDMHLHLGRYHTLVAMNGLHDESNWPSDIGIVETEERRRLFWSMYTLDVYTSVIWNGVIRCREQQSSVLYPTEVNDEGFSNNGFSSQAPTSPSVVGSLPGQYGRQVQTSSWLCGWNFITDLYRILEHVISHFRDRRFRARERSFLHDIFPADSTMSQTSVRNKVMFMYNGLPQLFKETPPVSFNVQEDRYGFQAANIVATVQLLRMVLFTASGASIQERCQIADEVISAFITVPVAYLQAISSPLMHHLGGIGSILGSVFEEPLSEADYSLVRSVLLTLAQLLSNLEVMHSGTRASEKLRIQIAQIDTYMDSQLGLGEQTQRRQGSNTEEATAVTSLANVDFSEYDDEQLAQSQIPSNLLGDFSWIFDFAQPNA